MWEVWRLVEFLRYFFMFFKTVVSSFYRTHYFTALSGDRGCVRGGWEGVMMMTVKNKIKKRGGISQTNLHINFRM